jgi:signal transduction histidine kinase/CheY-like chemotaxis protein
MREDLLKIYIRNHLSIYFLPVFIIPVFIWLQYNVYGSFGPESVFMSGVILVTALFLFAGKYLYFRKICQQQKIDYFKTVFLTILLKAGYIFPLLLLFFYPFQTDYMFDHLIGFIILVLAIGAYVAISAPCFSLFLSDLFFPVLFAAVILWINRESIEVPYIASGFFIFAAYSLLIGKKLHHSSQQLVLTNLKLAEAAQDARDANMAKSDFLSMISHEIRTPMHGIISTVEHLAETDVDKQQKESLNVIYRCADTLLKMLNDILDLSRIEARKYEIETIDFNLHEVIRTCIHLTDHQAKNKNIDLKCTIADTVPEIIRSDQVKIQQIITNLLSNAIKFTSQGFVALNASYDSITNYITIEVVDTGIGISAKNQKKLFEQFTQADNSIARQYGGSGLGLSIVKSFAGLLGGEIKVESKEGKGSTFRLLLPYIPPAESVDSQTAKPRDAALPADLAVLVAEDNVINQRSIERILSQQNIRKIAIVENGEEVLAAVQAHSFDVILMDMNMPIMDGIIATRKLKESEQRISSIPVIGITAATEERMINNFYEAGISSHIVKPFRKSDLLSGIAKIVAEDEEGYEEETQSLVLERKLEEIREDFGDAFFESFVKDSLTEIEKLWAAIQTAFENEDAQGVYQAAHDMCAVSGNIGMEETYKAAKELEKRASDRAPHLLEAVQKAMKAEQVRIREIIQ